MNRRTRLWTAAFSAAMLLALIVDARTALNGAREGIALCLQTVIASLFPFFVLSTLLIGALSGVNVPILRPIGKICGIPRGSEAILLTGFLGGYPVGAQAVCQAYRSGCISRQDAQRMLGFCSNAGPAFLFGMVAPQFPSLSCAWVLWGIHILSALIVAAALPQKSDRRVSLPRERPLTLSQSLERAVKTTALVCGWVVLFRILIAFLQRWVLWLLPQPLHIIVVGLLELSNGCCSLSALQGMGARFLASACFLSFGGLCVTMQTASVTAPLGLGIYLPCKGMQSKLSILLASVFQYVLFPKEECIAIPGGIFAVLLIAALFYPLVLKKTVEIRNRLVYNG